MEIKRQVIAALLRAGRAELANVVAYQVTAAAALTPSKIRSLKANDAVLVYHSTYLTEMSNLINGFDASTVHYRLYGGPKHAGLFVAPSEQAADKFGSEVMLEVETKAKFLHGTDYSGNIGRRSLDEKTEEWLREKYPDSFRPNLSWSLESKGEPQALLIGLVKPRQILRVRYRGRDGMKWYTRKEFIDLGLEAGDHYSRERIKDVGHDLSYPNYSKQQLGEILSDMFGVPAKHALEVLRKAKPEQVEHDLRNFGFGDRAVKKYVKILTADIVLPPRRLPNFIATFLKKMRALDQMFEQLKGRLDAIEKSSYENLREFYVDQSGIYVDGYELQRFITVANSGWSSSKETKLAHAADFIELSFQVLKEHEGPGRLQHIDSLADRFDRLVEELSRVQDLPVMKLKGTAWIKPVLEEYEKYVINKESADAQGIDYVKRADLVLLSKVVSGTRDILKASSDAAKRIRMIATQAREKYSDDDWKPPMEAVERMYHASVDAKQIGRKGFDKVVPSTKGLGGSQSDKSHKNAISFTSDLYVAKEVMRSLKEAIMVARGDVKAHQILEWAEKARIKDKVLDSAFMPSGKREPNDPVVAFAYYMSYLSWSKRYDPGFFGVPSKFVSIFKSLNPRDVGIVVAQVNTKHPDITFYPAMQEYRVPPEAVVEVEKVITG